MNNTKTTKRALLSSALATFICIAMLIGTTFAWFTDSASTAVNKIQAGKLDVALEMKDASGNWVNAEGETLSWKKAAGAPAGELVLWEPGCTYELPELRIVNKGNLALKYKIAITGINGDAELNRVIDWTINGAPINLVEKHIAANTPDTAFVIKGHMQESAGNEYQGLSIDGIGITVVATQDTVEYDSFNNTYDTNATYLNKDASGNYLISNANELVYFAKSVNVDRETYTGKTVKLTADIDLAGKIWIPVGQTGATQFQGIFDGQNKTIKNMTVNNPSESENVSSGFFGWIENTTGVVVKNVKFDNAKVTGSHYVGVLTGYLSGTVSGCEVKNSTVIGINMNGEANGDKIGGIVGYVNDGSVTNNSVMNSTVSGNRDIGGIAGAVATGVDYFNNNSVTDTTITYETVKSYASAGEIISGRTGFAPDATNTATNVTIKLLANASTAEELSQIVAGAQNSSITLSTGTYTLPAAANKTVAISGTKDTVIDLTSATGQSLSGTDLTFENVTVKGINSDYVGIQHSGDIVYNNVTFNDSTTLYGESVTFNNCTFNLSSRYIWTYGAKEVTFNNCTFTTRGKAILIYAEDGFDSQTVNVNGCTFNATEKGYTGTGDWCAAVEIDARLISGRYTVNFTGNNTVDSNFSGTYRIKNNSESKVTINGIN